MDNNFAVQLKKITKIFPNGLVANHEIDLNLSYGKIHAIFGENGAGKSTLIKILMGELAATSGKIIINGKEILNHNSKISKSLELAVVHQHFSLIDNFSVFENVILGNEIKNQSKVVIIEKKYEKKLHELEIWKKENIKKINLDKSLPLANKQSELKKIEQKFDEKTNSLKAKKQKTMQSFFCYSKKTKQDIQKIIDKFNLKINLDDVVGDLSVTKKQKIEILKVLFKKAKIIVFDESTSTISENDIKEFLDFLALCKKEGKAVIFISHKVKEIKKIADQITVLRKGKVVGCFDNETISEQQLIKLMIGNKDLLDISKSVRIKTDRKVILNVKNLNLNLNNKEVLRNVNFDLYTGEIVGLFGIEDNGQQNLLEAISQIEKNWTGEIYLYLNHKKEQKYWLEYASAVKTKQLGVSYIPQDRQKEGLLINDSLYFNTFFNNLYYSDWFNWLGLIKKDKILQQTNKIIKKYDVHGAFSPQQLVNSLSGGNQQKFIIGREFETNPDLFLINNPTWGIDIGMINHFNIAFLKMRNEGKTIFFASPDLDLVMSLSDRIFVINEGKITGQFQRGETDIRNKVGALITKKK